MGHLMGAAMTMEVVVVEMIGRMTGTTTSGMVKQAWPTPRHAKVAIEQMVSW